MKTRDIQQALGSFETVAVISGPCVVRVHKALDVIYHGTNRCGFFLSVDFRFRKNDAIHIGKPGYGGWSKTEATREANALAAKIFSYYGAMKAAEAQALQWDTTTNRYTVKLQTDRFQQLVGRYVAEIEPAP